VFSRKSRKADWFAVSCCRPIRDTARSAEQWASREACTLLGRSQEGSTMLQKLKELDSYEKGAARDGGVET
jgi:hypothetical protein